MEELRLADVAACVVGWHNRHPLARRIGASHVHAIGYVALPFSGGGAPVVAPVEAQPEPEAGGTLRERAEKRARQAQEPPVVVDMALDRKTLKPAFSEDFIDPLSPRTVARFAQQHALALARAPGDGPLRGVRADGDAPLMLYLMTAVVETGTRKSRVLIGGGAKPQVLGRRVLQPLRLALAVVPLVLLVAAGIAFAPGSLLPREAVVAAPAASAAPAPQRAASVAAVVVAAASAASAADAAVAASAPAASAAEAPTEAASAPPAAVVAQDGDPHLGRIVMPSIRPRLNLRKALAEEAAASAAAAAASGPALPAEPQVAHAPAPTPVSARTPAAPAPVAADHSFALSTRPLRTRAEADQTRVAMKSLLAAVDARGVRVDVLPEGDDWRVVGLPFASRNEAEKARTLLVSRGMKVQVVGF